ncbi:MAG: hypothetical protein ACRYF0_01325 [Janthinobacterium lividum]
MPTISRYVLPLVAVLVAWRGNCHPPVPPAPLAAFQAGAFQPLPLGTIQPTGWLRRQLLIQASGLSGHLEDFWPDLGPTSAWRGGTGEGWERGPYYLDGLLPLAYELDDAALKAKAQKWVEWALQSQRLDGDIGPVKNQDWWPNMLVLKALMQYQEATNDPRVVPFMTKYFAYQSSQLDQRPLQEWAVYRWAEELLPLRWLYQKTKNPLLLTLAGQLARQGFNWEQAFAHFPFAQPTTAASLGLDATHYNSPLALQAHGVNNAMALKMPVLWGLSGGTQADRQAIYPQLAQLDKYHGLPNGMFSSDEHLAGRNPSQGTELCTVVEAQFSYEQLLALLGDPLFGDRLEKITFNALPATFDPTMWAHQYDQQANQVLVSKAKRQWSTNGDESNVFGLEPHFGCCTANMHQGWPKFAASLWLAAPDGGLVAATYAPNRLTTVRGKEAVIIREETDYPFRETVRFVVEKAAKQAFSLRLRIPAWATQSVVTVNGKVRANAPQAGTFYVLNQRWQVGDVVELRLPMAVRVLPGFNQSVSVERGPLVYSLKLGEQWRKLRERPTQADDYEVSATTPWNYGLLLPAGGALPTAFHVRELPMTGILFSPDGAPVELQVPGVRLPSWQLAENSAGPPPLSPVAKPAGAQVETLTLIPYGAAKLRITSFPLVHP